ncbi:MAG: hypothetical protein KatS3mg098_276 [Candidatus Parcubacteria bacterium]|nr:MAG: hypothetical protein KatS3mg098_276 [Candidatus Parcubacteria bacterium]
MSPNVIKKEGFKNMKKTSASCFFKNNQGFSLMEMLIYVGILGIVASVATGIFLSVTKVQTEQSAQVEISGQLNFAMQTIQRLIRNSSLVDITPGTPTTSLTLRMKDSAVDPTTIYLENGRIYVKEGASGTPQSITSDKVVIDSLEFKKLTQYPGKDIVQIDLAMSAANKVEGSTIRRSLRSAVSRVSAATFDSDLIPGVDNTYSVGTSNRWKNASFSGNVGIGVTTLLNKLDVAGGVAIGSYAGVNTAPSNGLIVSGNVGIGVATPAGGTKLDIYTSNANEIGLLLRDDGGARIFSIAELGSGGYNPMSSAGDIGLIYYGSGGSNTGSLMIGQWSSSARGIKIDASGNVGIGTGTPGEKLEVAGNIKLSGATPTYKITNVASPTASSDVATKGYVDNSVGEGILNVYQSDGLNLVGQLIDLGRPILYDFTAAGNSQQARAVYSTRDSSNGMPTNQALIYSGVVDNLCDFTVYLSSSTNQIKHMITGDCSTFQGRASSTWYYSGTNCTGSVYINSLFQMAVNSGWEGWGDDVCTDINNNANNYYLYCLSLNHNQKAFWRGGYSTYLKYCNPPGEYRYQDTPSCFYNDYGGSLMANRSYQSYRTPTGTCINATGTLYNGIIISPTNRLCGSIASGTGECVIKP